MGAVPSRRTALDWDDRVLAAHSSPHFMQSSTWERIRSAGPWRTKRIDLGVDRDLPVLAFEREVPGLGVLRHLPRVSGIAPVDVAALTDALRASHDGAFATKLELHQPFDEALIAAFASEGWRPTRASQYRYSVVVEPGAGEDAMLAGMKRRARNEIRIAEQYGVTAEAVPLTPGNRLTMLALIGETADRSGAFFRPGTYLEHVWDGFAADGRGTLYFARHDGVVVSGAFVPAYGPNAWYKDGGSLRDQPQLMASRYLQWHIMRDLAARGVERYDLGHVPPPLEPDAPGRGLLVFKGAFAHEVQVAMPALLLAHEPRAEEWRVGESAFIEAYRARTGDYWY